MTQDIEHVVVRMLENRSFDHMLGYLKAPAAPLSDLQQAFVSQAHALDLGDDQFLPSLRLARRIATEHDAAVYVREVTRRHLSRRGKTAP